MYGLPRDLGTLMPIGETKTIISTCPITGNKQHTVRMTSLCLEEGREDEMERDLYNIPSHRAISPTFVAHMMYELAWLDSYSSLNLHPKLRLNLCLTSKKLQLTFCFHCWMEAPNPRHNCSHGYSSPMQAQSNQLLFITEHALMIPLTQFWEPLVVLVSIQMHGWVPLWTVNLPLLFIVHAFITIIPLPQWLLCLSSHPVVKQQPIH